ncbi:hypothetical protein IYW40_07870 [Methylocystis sp. H4A]|uniref:hypothetical protein n=1 Tax=Methylocystis sp. H4A TaxID=2785788 RepID=UPI0018C335F2|nr:hypothetical protein [Methylocystis sp. H4A]MBG0801397.1 hypothetical protein [Methylocystis sp. H4A]
MTDAPALLQRRFQLAEHTRTIYFVTVEQLVKPEDVLKPDFWRHVASQLRPYDEIIVATDSCEWRMELLVCDVWHCGARVVELSRFDMSGQEEEDQSVGDDLRVRWRGPVNKWCVVRASDSVVMRGGLENKNVALETLAAIAQERAAIGN